MLAFRSDPNNNEKILPIKLLWILQSAGFENCPHREQFAISFVWQQVLILHQVAFSFSLHPGHFPVLYFLQFPQYNPQAAIRL
jgi:hypothetical protein